MDTISRSDFINVGGRREMKWPAFEAPYFLFSSPLSLSVIQFSYLYGSSVRVRFNKLDSESTTTKSSMGQEGKKKYLHKWMVEEKYFYLSQWFVYMLSGIRTSDSHKYTKNVCMTGHNIKYHQNKGTKWKSWRSGGFPLVLWLLTGLKASMCVHSHIFTSSVPMSS